jgi:molybdopterin-guanine dinucleotide biosynthesis protein A
MPRVLGVVVAGGLGTRLELGRPKAFAAIGGRTLLEIAVASLAGITDEVVVSAPAELPLPVVATRRVADPPGAGGPMAGVVAAFAASEWDEALVLGIDFPLLDRTVWEALREAARDTAAALPEHGGVPQPLVSAWRRAGGAALAAGFADGERSLSRAAASMGAVIVPQTAWSRRATHGAEALLNVNTAADLERARRLAGGGGG